jgi:hypothetical protein
MPVNDEENGFIDISFAQLFWSAAFAALCQVIVQLNSKPNALIANLGRHRDVLPAS